MFSNVDCQVMVNMAARHWSPRRVNITKQHSAILTTLCRQRSFSYSLDRFCLLYPLPWMLSVSLLSPWIMSSTGLPRCFSIRVCLYLRRLNSVVKV